MTPREEIAAIFSSLGDSFHRLAILYRVPTAPPPGEPTRPKPTTPPPAAEHDEPANVNATPCPLRKGRALYAWSKDHDLVKRVNTLGKSWGYPERMVDWDAGQVASVYHEITAKAPAGAYPVQPATRQHQRAAR